MPDKVQPRFGLRQKVVLVLALATGLTLGIILFSYRLMLIKGDAFWTLSAAALGAGVLGGVTAYVLTRPILHDIERLVHASRQLADGDLKTRVDVRSRGELKELASSFNTMVSRLRERFEKEREVDRARRRLVANVSHDLRTPVSSVHALVQALQDGVVSQPDERLRYLKTIGREAEYMSRLLDDLAQLSELESGHLRLDRRPVHAEDLLAEVLEGLRFAVEQKGIRLDVHIHSSDSVAPLDPKRARQAFTNVIQNGIAYSPSGGTLKIAVQSNESSLVVTVTDEGPGIRPEQLRHVFERFYRGNPERGRRYGGGMGLGLAIAKELVELHGGSITVANGEGGGTRVQLVFPLTATGSVRPGA